MRTAVVITENTNATNAVGEALGGLCAAGDVLLLSGDLGAGKTQLVKGLARGLGVREPVTSPTFNILLVHEGRVPLFHVDLYRLERAEQLEDIDYFGTLESGGVTAVEWGDRFPEAAPDSFLSITLHIESDETRRLEVVGFGERPAALLGALRSACRGIPGVMVVAGDSA